MKVLFVDTACDGHHVAYLSALKDVIGKENCVMILPEHINVDCEQIICNREFSQKKIKDYFALLKIVSNIQKIFNADIIHFVYGDYFYRFFGAGLRTFKNVKLIFTFHSVRRGKIRDISLKKLFKYSNVGIVHTQALLAELHLMKIFNVKKIDYPCFNILPVPSQNACREKVGLKNSIPVIGVYGSTRQDKGLDILLAALAKIETPFQLLIAGKAEAFDEQYVINHSISFKERVVMCMKYLSDLEMQECIEASDIVVLPYRKIFNGASGPLVEGVTRGKKIVASSHGSLGYLVSEYHLGETFESENIDDLARVLEKELLNINSPLDSIAMEYAKTLKPEVFKEKYNELYNNC